MINDNYYTYQKNNGAYEKTILSNDFSSYSKFILEQVQNNFRGKKPTIIAFPKKEIKIIPLLVLDAAKETQADILVICDKNSMFKHLERYETLANEQGYYQFQFTIPIIFEEKGASLKILNKQVPSRKKRELTEYLFDIAADKNVPKVVFADHNFFSDALQETQSISFNDLAKSIDVPLAPKTIIIEDVDKLLFNNDIRQNVIDWLKQARTKDNIIIHTANSNIRRILEFEKEIDGDLCYFDYNMIQVDEEVNTFDIIKGIPKEKNIEIIGKIKVANIEELEENIKESLKLINYKNVPIIGKKLIKLVPQLNSTIAHPSQIKVLFKTSEGNYTYGSIDYLLKEAVKTIKNETDDFESYISLISALLNYYNTLKKTKRYGELEHYQAICKNTFLIERLKSNSNKKTLVVAYRKEEITSLNKQLIQQGLTENITVLHFKDALYQDDVYEEVILPGSMRSQSAFYQLTNTFHNIKIICYEGNDENHVQEAISSFSERNNKQEIIKSLTKTNNPYSKNMIEIAEKIPVVEQANKQEDIFRIIPEELDLDVISEPETNNHQYTPNKPYYLKLIDQFNNVVEIYVGEFSPILKVNAKGVPENTLPNELSSEDTIVRFTVGDESSIFSIMKKMYNLDELVNVELIQSWKEAFQNGLQHIKEINGKSTTLALIYRFYCHLCEKRSINPKTYATFIGWVKEKRIGPEDPKDVLALGIIGKFNEIEHIYEEIYSEMAKLRALHVRIGKKINTLTRHLLKKEHTANLTFEEQVLMEKIRIYKVIEVKKVIQ